MRRFFSFSCFVLFFLVLLSSRINAQNIHVQAKLDRSSIALGDQTVLSLSVSAPAKVHISFPLLTDTISAKVLVVKPGKTDTVSDHNNSGIQTITRRYVLTSFDAGLQMIPGLTFQSGTTNFKTEALSLQVLSVKVDTTKAIYDIKQPLAVSYSWIDWLKDHWPWIAVPLLVLLVALGVFYYIKKNRKIKPVLEEVKPLIPPHQLALEKLAALKTQKLWQQGQVKQYHSEVSDIIREYLEKRYHVNSLEQTSEEIFLALRHLEIPDQNRQMLRQILSLADLVKFAKEQPLPGENERSLDNAMHFVEQTKEQQRQAIENKDQKGGHEHI